MDVSKLPKLSQKPTPGVPAPETVATEPRAALPVPVVSIGGEAWISVGIGLLLLLLTPTSLAYFSSKVFHTKFEPFADPTRPFPAKCDFILFTDGTKSFYRDTLNYWSDLVITVFALALILDGVVLAFFRKPGAVMFALTLTVLSTLANLVYLFTSFSNGIAIWSAVAVIMGVYMAILQWTLFQSLARRAKPI